MAASERKDRVGPANCPEHPGLREAGTDYGLAARFDHPGADEQMLTAELGISHPLCVVFKVVGFDADLLGHFRIAGVDGAKGTHELFDFPLVEQAALVVLDPGFLIRLVIGIQLARQLPEVLTRME